MFSCAVFIIALIIVTRQKMNVEGKGPYYPLETLPPYKYYQNGIQEFYLQQKNIKNIIVISRDQNISFSKEDSWEVECHD